MIIEIPDELFNKYPSIGIYFSEYEKIQNNVDSELPIAMFDFPKPMTKINITELDIQTNQDKVITRCTFKSSSV